jgi:hypothetical protein
MNKPPIVEVIAGYIQLRKAGTEYVGLCPFHRERTPSFHVNEDKGVYHCFGCGASGDVLSFVQQIEGIAFKQALAWLGIDRERKRYSRIPTQTIHAAALLARWLNRQYLLLGVRLRELSRDIALAEQIPDYELAASLSGEWELLSEFHEGLAQPESAAELWAVRRSIEAITDEVEPEPLLEFPPLTPAYQAYLRSVIQ